MRLRRAFAVGLVLFLAAAIPSLAEEWKKSFKVSGTPEVRIEAMDGNIRVKSSASKEVEVRVTTVGWRISEDEVRVIDRQTGDRVEIELRIPRQRWVWNGNRSITIDLTVPRDANLDLHTGDGNISAESLAGPLRFDTGDGNITLDGASGRVSLHTGDGNISASALDGALDAQTGDGNVVVEGRFDELTLRTGDGNIDARVGQRSKIVNSWNIRTGDGSVTVRLPEGFGADLDAHTGDGSIRLAFPVSVSGKLDESTVRGRMNNGGGSLIIRSGDGPIRIERL